MKVIGSRSRSILWSRSIARLSLEIDLDLRIDLDLDPITFIHELNLDIIEIYLYTKNEVHRSRHSKVID